MKIALAQINPTVGALEANKQKILRFHEAAAGAGAELVVFPELALTGYPPRDLLDMPDFIRRNTQTVEELAVAMRGGPGAIVGFAQPVNVIHGKRVHNAAALIDEGRLLSTHFKSLLPTYDVFDEGRYFEPAHERKVGVFRGVRLGITICEDIWNDELYLSRRLYHDLDPVAEMAEQGVALLIHIAASPFHLGKRKIKAQMYQRAAQTHGVPLVQVNVVGGNDSLIFDGWSNVWSPEGGVVAQAARFREDLVLWDREQGGGRRASAADVEDTEEDLYDALKLGVRDYVGKCGFSSVHIGLSGGIDSALTAALAVDALGADAVVGISMPSHYSSEGSKTDAQKLAAHLGIAVRTVQIGPVFDAFLAELEPLLRGASFGVAEENLQARLRGDVLMTLSNKFGTMVLTTGNKSEMAVGYCTLYGDMSGGLAVLADVLKTRVYKLANWVNRNGERIPHNSIHKPPSAELRANQRDTDSLPPYDRLDPIIEGYIEQMLGPEELIARGNDPEMVARIVRMIDFNEYKRQQAPPTLKVTPKAFGFGRRMPIARGE